MVKIMFICHGNICRSPMAEFVMQDMVEKCGLSDCIYTASAATSTEEIGNPVHRGTAEKLGREGVPMRERRARQLKKSDYDEYDYLVAMDKYNVKNILRITGGDRAGKVRLLSEFWGEQRDIADPWYTGDFDTTYNDIARGCEAMLNRIRRDNGWTERKRH